MDAGMTRMVGRMHTGYTGMRTWIPSS
jgi:hypothetical protein